MVSLLSNVDRSHTQCNASSIYLEQRFVCSVDVQLIFKNIRRNKRSLLNVNLEKYPKRIQHFVINFKMELFVNFVIDFKLQTIFAKRFILDVSQVLSSSLTTINQTFRTNNKRAISRFFGKLTLTIKPGFYLFKVNNRDTKNTRARCEMCLKLTVKTPEWRQWH